MNKYLRWIIKLVVLCILVFLCDFGAGKLYSSLHKKCIEFNPNHIRLKTQYTASYVTDDIVIIGASEPAHNYIAKTMQDSLGLDVYNGGRDGSFFVFQNVLIRLVLERYNPKVIIWDVIEDCLKKYDNNSNEYQNMRLLYPYYDTNQFCREKINEKNKWQSVMMHSQLYRNNSSFFEYLQALMYKEDGSNKGYIPLSVKGYDYPTRGHVDLTGDIIDNDRVDMLKETIQCCKNQGVQLIMVSSPMFYYPDFRSTNYYRKLIDVFSENEIVYLDYYSCPPFDSDSTLFKDRAHLNQRGAEIFTEMLIPKLKNVIE